MDEMYSTSEFSKRVNKLVSILGRWDNSGEFKASKQTNINPSIVIMTSLLCVNV